MIEQLYECYVRNADGRAFDTNIRDGVANLLSGNGYRLSINIEGVVFTLRKGSVSGELRHLDDMLPGQTSIDCAVTIRGHQPLLEISEDESDD